MNEYVREVEINGIKMEVDMRYARRIDTFKVGDNVKILRKGNADSVYDKDDHVFPGMIVDFANFKELPTLVIAYYKDSYNAPSVDFLYFNANTTGYEIVYCDESELIVSENSIRQRFDHEIERKQRELDELIAKRDYFFEKFVKKEASNG